jgi:hypothetical protein
MTLRRQVVTLVMMRRTNREVQSDAKLAAKKTRGNGGRVPMKFIVPEW